MDTFLLMLNQMIGLFLLIILGYFLSKKEILPKEAASVLSKLATKIFLPVLVCSSFIEKCTLENLMNYGSYVIVGGITVSLNVLAAILITRCIGGKYSEYEKGIFRYGMSIPNTGAFGLPVVQVLFGAVGVFQFNLFLLINNLICYTWGMTQLIPQKTDKKGIASTIRNILTQPVLVGILVGSVIGLSGLSQFIPEVVTTTMKRLADCYTVPALLTVGIVIADYPISEIINKKIIYVITFFRLILVPIVFLTAARFLNLSSELMIMLCMFITCPCGMNAVVFPASYGKDTRTSAGLVLVTSLLAVITIPIFYATL